MFVACARGIGGEPDDVSHRLVPPLLARALMRTMRTASLGLVPHVKRRTLAIDDAVCAYPTPQLVILGAGLDARAHRLPELRDTVVFEIDHPSTQAYKKPRAENLPRCAKEVRYVAVDFLRDDLAERLVASGHERMTPTNWIWEGVTMYLTPEAVRETLATIAARSAPSSRLAMTYVTRGRSARVTAPLFAVLGEPLGWFGRPDEVVTLLGEHGFVVESDLAPETMVTEHVVVSVRGR